MEDSSQQIYPEFVGRSLRVIGDEMNDYYLTAQNEGHSPWIVNENVREKIVNILYFCIHIIHIVWLEI